MSYQPQQPGFDPNQQPAQQGLQDGMPPQQTGQPPHGTPSGGLTPPQKTTNKTPIIVTVVVLAALIVGGAAAVILLGGGSGGTSKGDTPEEVVQKYIDGPLQDARDGDMESAQSTGVEFICDDLKSDFNDKYDPDSAETMDDSTEVHMEVKESDIDGDTATVDVDISLTMEIDGKTEYAAETVRWEMKKEDGVWKICDTRF
ncbi:hypothetical protein [Haloglycomyces albus]|uniref:Rv0361 family membrane protein n=1 Tax=Haloglycomyces albus TaxID=526067 RepID=UPI00046CE12A|nr:hypothetical protein [Haloglycomyces albus]